jgi:hypothetical protein
VARSRERGDESSGSGSTELVFSLFARNSLREWVSESIHIDVRLRHVSDYLTDFNKVWCGM